LQSEGNLAEEQTRRQYAGNYAQQLIRDACKKVQYTAELEEFGPKPSGSSGYTARYKLTPLAKTTTTYPRRSSSQDAGKQILSQDKLDRLVDFSDSQSNDIDLNKTQSSSSTLSQTHVYPVPTQTPHTLSCEEYIQRTFYFSKQFQLGMNEPMMVLNTSSGIVQPPTSELAYLGIKIKHRPNRHEMGDHLISAVDPESVAHLAGVKPGSKILRVNEMHCDDKTHEFVLFYVNYLLEKNTCDRIELVVAEPMTSGQSRTASFSSSLPLSSKSCHHGLNVGYYADDGVSQRAAERATTRNVGSYSTPNIDIFNEMVALPPVDYEEQVNESAGIQNLKSIIEQISAQELQTVKNESGLRSRDSMVLLTERSQNNFDSMMGQVHANEEYYVEQMPDGGVNLMNQSTHATNSSLTMAMQQILLLSNQGLQSEDQHALAINEAFLLNKGIVINRIIIITMCGAFIFIKTRHHLFILLLTF
jgi:hypothetical protein